MCRSRSERQRHTNDVRDVDIRQLRVQLVQIRVVVVVRCMPKRTRSLAIANRPCDCRIILKSGYYTKAIIVLIGLFRPNRERRQTCRRVIIEKRMYIAQMPLDNAFVSVTSATVSYTHLTLPTKRIV